jgi:hypothetical protein
MLRFFRRARQKFILKKEVKNYLLYALGEIMLVVIGILIALQINNWNAEAKNQGYAESYLKGIKQDLAFDVTELDRAIRYNEYRIKSIDSIGFLVATREELSKAELLDFVGLHADLDSESYFIPEKSTIKQVQASSQGNLITNEKLRKLIFRYYSICDRNEKNNEVSLQLYQHNYITEIVHKTMFYGGESLELVLGQSFGRPLTDFSKLTENTDYIFALNLKQNHSESQNDRYRNIQKVAKDISAMIDEELNK